MKEEGTGQFPNKFEAVTVELPYVEGSTTCVGVSKSEAELRESGTVVEGEVKGGHEIGYVRGWYVWEANSRESKCL